MRDARLHRIAESGYFEWPWATSSGLAIIAGADGGGGEARPQPCKLARKAIERRAATAATVVTVAALRMGIPSTG